jgi:hypothetical protein
VRIVRSSLCAAAVATAFLVSTAWAAHSASPSPNHGGMLVESGSGPGPNSRGPEDIRERWPGFPYPEHRPVPKPVPPDLGPGSASPGGPGPEPVVRAAPGPIAGAGLPVMAVIGVGYWAYRRFRRRRRVA